MISYLLVISSTLVSESYKHSSVSSAIFSCSLILESFTKTYRKFVWLNSVKNEGHFT
jgi:hypothetical protein